MAPFVEFDLAVIIHSTTESVRLYGTPVSIGGKTPNMLTVRSGRQTVSCRGLAVPGARNTQSSFSLILLVCFLYILSSHLLYFFALKAAKIITTVIPIVNNTSVNIVWPIESYLFSNINFQAIVKTSPSELYFPKLNELSLR